MSRLLQIGGMVLLLTLFVNSPGLAKDVKINSRKPLSSQMVYENSEYIIRHSINLKEETVEIPTGCTLVFERSGRIRNGKIKGKDTKIESSKNKIFKQVKLLGTFNSDESRPEWFIGEIADIALRNCLAFFQGVVLDNSYLVSSSIIINNPISISGKGSLFFKEGVEDCIDIRSSNVSISGISVNNQDINSKLIHAQGDAQRPLKFIDISGCTLKGGMFSVVLDYCDSSKVSGCLITDVEHTAIGLYSTHYIEVRDNTVSNINIHHRQQNSYGITASYHYGDAKSTDINISGNLVSNNPYWEALDTHGGERIVFSKNIVMNGWRGVAAVGDNHRDMMLCKEITIEENDITCSNEPLSNGIVFTGVGVGNLSQDIKVINNQVAQSVIALYSNHNENVVISQNDLFASDEIWRDIGSRKIKFTDNIVELSSGKAVNYEKSVFYFKPTETVANVQFGEVSNNTIVARGASMITEYGSFRALNSSVLEKGNRIAVDE